MLKEAKQSVNNGLLRKCWVLIVLRRRTISGTVRARDAGGVGFGTAISRLILSPIYRLR